MEAPVQRLRRRRWALIALGTLLLVSAGLVALIWGDGEDDGERIRLVVFVLTSCGGSLLLIAWTEWRRSLPAPPHHHTHPPSVPLGHVHVEATPYRVLHPGPRARSPGERAVRAVVGALFLGSAAAVLLTPVSIRWWTLTFPLAVILAAIGGTLLLGAMTDVRLLVHASGRDRVPPPTLRRVRAVRLISGAALVVAAVLLLRTGDKPRWEDEHRRVRQAVGVLCLLFGAFQIVRGLFPDPPRPRHRQVF